MNSIILKEKIEKLIEPMIKDNFLELVQVEVIPGKQTWVRIKLDKISGGINIDECGKYGALIGQLLDEADIIPGSYNLEVGSPGVDRPLLKPADYERFKGRNARIFTEKKVDKDFLIEGKIIETGAETVTLNVKGRNVTVEFSNIKKANLDI